MQSRRSLRQSMLPTLPREENGSQFAAPLPNNAPRYSLSGANPRVSLGPQRNFKQVQNDFSAMSLSQPSGDARKSSNGAENGRQSLGVRRSSIGAKGAGLGNSNFSGKEPRPIRDKNFQNNGISVLLNHLIQSGFDFPISAKILTAPSSKDFQNIFKFLYSQIDLTFVFDKKFEEEVPVLMKGLKYPFANDISKSQLQAVGSMHTWPILLAMLVWMVELIQICSSLEGSEDTMSPRKNSESDEIFLEYLFETYKRFLAGIDDNRDILERLEKAFDQRNESALSEVHELMGRAKEMEKTAAEISDETPLVKAQRENQVYASDIEKFKKFIEHLDLRRQKFFEVIHSLEQDIAQTEGEYKESEELKTGYQVQVDAQPVCPEDIDKMNTEKDQLLKSLEALSRMKEEASKLFWEREVEVQKRMDLLEKFVFEYNSICERIGLVPQEAPKSMGFELGLHILSNSNKLEAVLDKVPGEEIIEKLSVIREECLASLHKLRDAFLQAQEEYEKLSELLSEREEHLKCNSDRYTKYSEQYTSDREVFSAENRKNVEEIEKLEYDLQKMRSDMAAGYLKSQQSLQKVTISYDQTLTRTSEEKEMIGKEIFRILEELINFKTLVETSLSDMERVYDREVLEIQQPHQS